MNKKLFIGSKHSAMIEGKDNEIQKNYEKLNFKGVAAYFRNYARNCRYSFLNMLST